MGLQIGIHPKIRDFLEINQMVQGIFKDEKDKRLNYNFIKEHFINAVDRLIPSTEFIEVSSQILESDCTLEPKALKKILDYRSGVYPTDIGMEPW